MKPSILLASAALASSALLVSCGEKATEGVAEAAVSEAKEKVTEVVEESIRYTFTPDSKIEFIGSKPGGSHTGGFEKFDGYFSIADGKPVGNDHKVVIDVKSMYTDDDGLTKHLLDPDFFNSEEYPESKFDVISITQVEGEQWKVVGNFTLLGETRETGFDATVSQDGETVNIDAEFKIKRSDFDMKFGLVGENVINDEVVIKLDLEAKPETTSAEA